MQNILMDSKTVDFTSQTGLYGQTQNDFGYDRFISLQDMMVMGRGTLCFASNGNYVRHCLALITRTDMHRKIQLDLHRPMERLLLNCTTHPPMGRALQYRERMEEFKYEIFL